MWLATVSQWIYDVVLLSVKLQIGCPATVAASLWGGMQGCSCTVLLVHVKKYQLVKINPKISNAASGR